MTRLERALTIAVASFGVSWVAAVAALDNPEWGAALSPRLVMIPNSWVLNSQGPAWKDWVYGSILAVACVGALFESGSLPRHQSAKYLALGGICGMLSWIAGVLPVLAAMVVFLLIEYFSMRLNEENRIRASVNMMPTVPISIEKTMLLIFGMWIFVGIWHGLGDSLFVIVVGLLLPAVLLLVGETTFMFFGHRVYDPPGPPGTSGPTAAGSEDRSEASSPTEI